MQITREYVKSYLEQYGAREKEYKYKLEQLSRLKEKLNSFERHNSEVKTFNTESRQDRLIPLITDLENELKADRDKIDKMFIERDQLLQKVSSKYLFILWGKYLNCKTYNELASEYGKSKCYIQTRINKGIDELVEILKNKQAKKVQWYNIHIV